MFRAPALALLILTCTTLAAGADADPAVAKKRASRSLSRLQAVQSPDCGAALPLTCGALVESTTVGLPDLASGYACVEYDESGGEVVYRIDLASRSEIDLQLDGMTADLDLFLLGSCAPGDCQGASTGVSSERLRRCLEPGTYYVVVDGYAGAASAFRLTLACGSCSPCTPAASHDTCDRAVAVPIHPAAFHAQGDTRCAADDYSDDSCTGYSALGHDVAYKLSMPPGCRIDVRVGDGADGIPTDFSIYLATSCDDARGTCVAGSDQNLVGEESFTYESPLGGIYYLIVDGFGNGTSGDYELDIQQTNCSVVGTQPATWQQVKFLYR